MLWVALIATLQHPNSKAPDMIGAQYQLNKQTL